MVRSFLPVDVVLLSGPYALGGFSWKDSFASGCCFAFWSTRAWWISWKDTVVGRPVLDCPAAGANSLRLCARDQKMEPTECGQAEDPLCPSNRNAGNRFHN